MQAQCISMPTPQNANSVSHISGSGREGLTLEDGFPMTLEAEVVFPEKISNAFGKLIYTGIPIFNSIVVWYAPGASKFSYGHETDLTWAATDNANLQVFAMRYEV